MALAADLKRRLVLPTMVAPMFLVSGVELAIASCRAGLVGSLTRNHCRNDAELEAQLTALADARATHEATGTGTPFGPLAVNVSLRMARDGHAAALDICRRHGVDIVITAAGNPAETVAAVHDWGGRIFHDATSIRFAEKAVAAGVDGIIAIGAGGGGHSGPISHLALIPQIRAMFDGTIVMAGAIATGTAIRAAEVLGADLAYLGTRFIATREAAAPDAYKAMLVEETADDLVYTDAINGTPAMWLNASLRALGLDPRALPVPAERPPHVRPWSNLWSAGQGIGSIRDVPSVAELVARLRAEYRAATALPPFAA